MGKVLNKNYILIQGWMINELQLKGNELLIYAIIYRFSQAENQSFNGGLQYLADWTRSTKHGVMKNLKSLVEKGLIDKNETLIQGVKFCEYRITKFNMGMQQSYTGYATKLHGGMQQSLPNNILDNTNNNKLDNKYTFGSIITEYTDNEDLKKALNDFVEMRKKKDKGFTTRALELNLNKLDKLALDDVTKIEIVNQTVANGWKSFYELKTSSKKQAQQTQQTSNPFLKMMLEGNGYEH